MAQIATITVETADGPVDLPVYEPGDSGSGRLEAFRVQTASGPGFVPLAAVDEADRPYLRVQTSSGVRAVDTSASGIPDSEVSRPQDNDSISDTGKRGIVVNPNNALSAINGTISSNTTGLTTAYVYDDTDTEIAQKDISGLSSGDTFKISVSLSAGEDYWFVADAGGSSYTTGYFNSGGHPYTSTDIDIVGGAPDTTTKQTSGNANSFNIVTVGAFLA